MSIQFFKQFLCRHQYELNRWHVCHDPNGMGQTEIEAEYICLNCGKVSYGHYNISHMSGFLKICNQYERRIK